MENSFRIGFGIAQLFVTLDFNKLLKMNYITSVEYISFAGETILLMLFISGVHILDKWYIYNNINIEALISTKDTTYVNNNIALEWL